jgi:hypothetical protein
VFGSDWPVATLNPWQGMQTAVTRQTFDGKPEGGFVAHASDPSLPPLEAPTRQELQQKIQANINATLAAQFPGLNLPSGSKELKFDFHIEAKPGGGFALHSNDTNAAPIEGASHEEIEYPFAEQLTGVVGKQFQPELSQALAKQEARRHKGFRRTVKRHCKPRPQELRSDRMQNYKPSGTIPIGDVVNAGDSFHYLEKSKSWPSFVSACIVCDRCLMYFFRHRQS